jgi:arylsulfatase A-like enzyme
MTLLRRTAPLLAAVSLGCSGPATEPSASAPQPGSQAPAVAQQPDLVIFLTSGLRADVDGHPGAEAAFVQALGLGPALRFPSAYAQSSSTFVSLGSLLTGLYPAAVPLCGIDYSAELSGADSGSAWCTHLPQERYSLPEVLGIYGYRTALISTGLGAANRYAGEFQHALVEPEAHGPPEEEWRDLGQRAQEWWVANADAPRLLVVVRPGTNWMGPLGGPRTVQPGRAVETTPEQEAAAEARYREVAAALGRGAGQVLAGLDASAARPRWTAVSSLHGLSLFEPQGFNDEPVDTWDHNVLLDRTLRVPLYLQGPDLPAEGATVEQIVELADLFPTFAALAGATPPAALHGEDLLTIQGAGDPRAWAYAELGDMLTVRQAELMLVFRTFLHDRPSLDPELDKLLRESSPSQVPFYTMHDVVADPGQHEDLRRQRPGDLERMRALMQAIRSGPGAVAADAMDAEKVWDLRMSRTQSYW